MTSENDSEPAGRIMAGGRWPALSAQDLLVGLMELNRGMPDHLELSIPLGAVRELVAGGRAGQQVQGPANGGDDDALNGG